MLIPLRKEGNNIGISCSLKKTELQKPFMITYIRRLFHIAITFTRQTHFSFKYNYYGSKIMGFESICRLLSSTYFSITLPFLPGFKKYSLSLTSLFES